jgi:DNA polymerase-3 subunit epsilon
MTSQLDMFSENAQSVRRTSAPSLRARQAGSAPDEAEMVRILQATGRYQILKKLEARPIAAIPRPGYPLRGVILDTETTGLDARKDEIIEIGLIAYSDEAGHRFRFEAGQSFRFHSGRRSDLKAAIPRTDPGSVGCLD